MAKKFPGDPYSASNVSRPADLFIKRSLYKSFAYYNHDNLKAFELPPPIKDFWTNEDCLYGRVNPSYTPVLCGPERLIEIEDNIKVVNFVADAYVQFKKEFVIALAQNRFPVDIPPLTQIKAVQGYRPCKNSHRLGHRLLKALFIKRMTTRTDLSDKITSLKSFVPPFLEFLKEQGASFPINFSSFVGGVYTTVMETGLAFEISTDYTDDSDAEKIKAFINHPYFEFYKTVALKYGFYIDMNAPWRLVANLSSQPMKLFMAPYLGNPSPTKYFQIFTSPTFLNDINELQMLAVETYVMLQRTRPTIKHFTTIRGSTQSSTIFREPATYAQLTDQFPYLYWLRFYIELKNVEKETEYSVARLDHIFNNSKNLVKALDKSSALRYINKYYDDVRSTNGSFNYDQYKKFFSQLDEKNWPFNDFQEYFKQVMALASYRRY